MAFQKTISSYPTGYTHGSYVYTEFVNQNYPTRSAAVGCGIDWHGNIWLYYIVIAEVVVM